ncbi:hypothetical protein [Streptomyces sp. 7-21]|jgi:hypothetical protein|nr:hypothetical protein [Streptomyces sp. 7-21]MBL1066479.1 hypothetical protein [Streptomyces sp. 7-21]
MSTAPAASQSGQNTNDTTSASDRLREKVKEANAQSEANRLIKNGR